MSDDGELELMINLLLREMRELKAKNVELESKIVELTDKASTEIALSNISNTDVLSNRNVASVELESDNNLSDKTKADIDKCIDFIFQYADQDQSQQDLKPRWRKP